MTINFYDAGNGDGLFDILGKAFHAQATANTARGTTVPAQVDDVFTQLNNLSAVDPDYESYAGQLPAAVAGFQSSGSGLLSSLRQFCQSFLIEFVNNDALLADRELSTALAELRRQMIANGESLDASTPALTVAYGATNTGDGKLVASIKRGDGRVQESVLAEVLSGTFLSNGRTAAIQFKGEAAAASQLSHTWPRGSGATTSVPSIDAASSLLANGDFEDEDDIANMPDDWYASVGTIGTTIKMTNVEEQTVIIASDPTTGYYRLLWVTPAGDSVATAYLPYNASGADVQAALRQLPGLSAVTVVTTGTSPNFTHTITFTGIGGNLNELTSENGFDTGTISHNTTVSGSVFVYAGGKAVEFDSNGSQLTTIQQRLANLTTKASYAVSLWAAVDVVPAGGIVTVDLIDGIAGTIIRDDLGMLNSFSFGADDLLTTWQHCTDVVAAVNEVQTLTITGTPDGGDFTLYDGVDTTDPIAYNADAATVQAAIIADLGSVGTGDVVCGGGALPGTPVTITFQGRLAGRAMPLLTADGSGLTGGTAPDAAVSLTTLGSPSECVFRTPAVLPEIVYFRIRISTAISAGTSMYLDHAAMSRMQALYAGGPAVASFSGSTEWKAGDTATITATNDRAGLLGEWMERNFGLANLGITLPSDAGGAETVPDAVVG